MSYSTVDTLVKLTEHLQSHILHGEKLLVLTGAGISADSGLPVYRDENRQWQHSKPMQYQDFIRTAQHRQRYWMGSYLGWSKFSRAEPNAAHRQLAAWEAAGWLTGVITQNVDGLHQQAGSKQVIDLHGRLDVAVCLDCRARCPRAPLQKRFIEQFGDPEQYIDIGDSVVRPDGDIMPIDALAERFSVPDCPSCAGVLKPDVVFFGENIPAARKRQAEQWLEAAAALLVVGSSLSVFSGYRFVREAHEQGKPSYCLNLGETRGDALFDVKATCNAAESLPQLGARLGG